MDFKDRIYHVDCKDTKLQLGNGRNGRLGSHLRLGRPAPRLGLRLDRSRRRAVGGVLPGAQRHRLRRPDLGRVGGRRHGPPASAPPRRSSSCGRWRSTRPRRRSTRRSPPRLSWPTDDLTGWGAWLSTPPSRRTRSTTAPPSPPIGFGTYPLTGEDGIAAIVSALEAGYRLLDTAVNYENETEVGEAIRRSASPREEIMVTSKLPGRHHGVRRRRSPRSAGRCERLGLEYLDLHLIHWPNPSVDKYVEAWRALVDLQREGLVRSIGVSNFTEAHLHRIIDDTGVDPGGQPGRAAPVLPAGASCARSTSELGIRTEAGARWASATRRSTSDPVTAAAAAHGVTPGAGDPALARAARLAADPEVRRTPSVSGRTSTSSASS